MKIRDKVSIHPYSYHYPFNGFIKKIGRRWIYLDNGIGVTIKVTRFSIMESGLWS